MTASGRVKWFSGKKGFGFVTLDSGDSDDVFVHISVVRASNVKPAQLVDDAPVVVEVAEHKGRLRARSIKLGAQ
jgi:CspA family cold shock protein